MSGLISFIAPFGATTACASTCVLDGAGDEYSKVH
jgi:hypothetical protein